MSCDWIGGRCSGDPSSGNPGLPVVALSAVLFLLLVSPRTLPGWQTVPDASFGPVVEELVITSSSDRRLSLLHTRDDVRRFTRRLQDATRNEGTEADRIAAIVDLCGLYLSVLGDPRFATTEPLQGFRKRIAGRLQQEVKWLKRHAADRTPSPAADGTGSQASRPPLPAGTNQLNTELVDPHWDLLARYAGASGPVSYFGSGWQGSSGHFLRGMAAGEPFDNGPELVALIEAILHPDFWQSAGGSGTIVYYRPLRVMVIRATTEVHEDLEHFLERLR